MLGGGIGGYHSDVLNASPEDEDGKQRLVEELKSRAKGSLKNKNYPEAIELYTKGLELEPNSSVLFANRSMCHLGMGASSLALNDADKAIEYDASYVKAYYRKGAALMALKRYSESKDVFSQGLALSPEDKELQQQYNKACEEESKKVPAKAAATATTSTSTTVNSSSVKKPNPSSKPPTAANDNEESTTEEDIIRGYKKTSDGRTTSYFHNELDENTKALIGSIAPKKLDSSVVPMEISSGAGSAWNTAGTVESVNHTPWAVKRLEELLEFAEAGLPGDGNVSVKKVKSVKGDAEILIVRGKRKVVYDLSIELEWELVRGEAKANGSMTITDISADLDLEVSVQVDRSKALTSDANEMVKSHVQSGKVGLQRAVLDGIEKFVEEFKSK
jgi:tetratricopeptide (TPR) repeat protein